MDKRYQVFISSTYLDLIEERQEAMQTLLKMNCIPSGMELFPAVNTTQWELIKKIIDDCDYYLLIIGGRYGSICEFEAYENGERIEKQISYTEMEYRYACDKKKPIIAFLHSNPNKLIEKKIQEEKLKYEETEEEKEKLKKFMKSIEDKRYYRNWNSLHELGKEIGISMSKFITDNPSPGWVKGDTVEKTISIENIFPYIDDSKVLEYHISKEVMVKGNYTAPELKKTKFKWKDILNSLQGILNLEITYLSFIQRLDIFFKEKLNQEIEPLNKDLHFKYVLRNYTIPEATKEIDIFNRILLELIEFRMIEYFKIKEISYVRPTTYGTFVLEQLAKQAI